MYKIKISCIFLICLGFSSCLKIQKKTNDESPLVHTEKAVSESTVVYELNEDLSLTQDTEIIADKVILGPNAHIYTHQFALTIKTEVLDSAIGAFIQNFPETHLVAELETDGLNAGITKIKTNEAYGNLQIRMNGQQGGLGLAGWHINIDLICQPNSGRDSGQSGSFFFEAEKEAGFFLTTVMNRAPGGKIGAVKAGPINKIPVKPLSASCYVMPKDGKPGIPGQICIKLSADSLPVCEKF